MMKNMYLKLTGFVASLVMFASCSKAPDYLNVLPDSSVVVAKVNVGNLLTESEVLTDPQVAGFLKNGINELQGDTRTLMRELLDNPSNLGLDLGKELYVALENVEQMRGLVVVPVSDEEKLKNVVATLLADREMNLNCTLTQQNGINKIQDERGNAIAAFDAEKMVIPFSNGTADAMEYMTPKDGAGKSDELNDFIQKKADVAYYIDYGQIVTLLEGAQPQLEGMDLEMLKEAKFISTLNFEKGKAVMATEFVGSDEIEKVYNDIYANPSNDLAKYLPQTTWAAAQLSVKDLAVVKDFFKGEIANQMNQVFDKVNAELQEKGIQAKVGFELLSSIKGDVIAGATPVVKNGYRQQPQGILVAECANKDLFDLIAALIMEENEHAEKVGNDLYSLGVNMRPDWSTYDGDGLNYTREGYDYYFGYDDGKMFVMPENLYQQCASGNSLKGFSQSLEENATLFSMLKGTNGLALDCNSLASEIRKNGDSKEAHLISNTLQKFESFVLKTNEPIKAEFLVTMTDKDTEFLKQIKDICIKFAIAKQVR